MIPKTLQYCLMPCSGKTTVKNKRILRRRGVRTISPGCAPATLVCSVLLLISLGATAAHPVQEIIEALFRAEQALPAPLQAGQAQIQPELHSFLYDDFANLEAGDFLKGATFTLQKYPPPSDPAAIPAYTQEMDYKLRVLFAYYPLAARSPADFTDLLDLIYDIGTPLPLRLFLLRHTATGLEARSTLGACMQGYLEYDGEIFEKKLREIIQLPQESKAVQMLAMDVLLARTEHDYATLLTQDALLINAADKGGPVHVRQFIDNPDAIPVSRRTQILLQRKNDAVGVWARTLKAIANNAGRDATLRAKAGEVLEVVLRDFPISNRDAILHG